MQAVILAAGLGSRLKKLTENNKIRIFITRF